MKTTTITAAAAALALVAAGCGSDSTESAASTVIEPATDQSTDATTPVGGTDASATTDSSPADSGAGSDVAALPDGCDPLPLKNDGSLTVATGETVFPPWMGAGEDDFDDPSTGTGYEGALVFALADQLGLSDVQFVRTGFDSVIAPGEKDWDFNIQQYSITPERDEVVDFSDGYYDVDQAIIGAADSPAASATSIADLKDLRLGAAIGTTSLDYAENVIDPSSDVQVYDDNSAAKAAFDAGQVDAIVFDLPTAYYITAVEITDASIIGVLPAAGDPDELGMLFEDGSPLVPCVNAALATLRDDGTLDDLEATWLNQGGDIPTISN